MNRKQLRRILLAEHLHDLERAPSEAHAKELLHASGVGPLERAEMLRSIRALEAPGDPAEVLASLPIARVIERVLTEQRRQLTSRELVDSVRGLRPDVSAASVHAEIRRMLTRGKLRRSGSPRGGTYELGE